MLEETTNSILQKEHLGRFKNLLKDSKSISEVSGGLKSNWKKTTKEEYNKLQAQLSAPVESQDHTQAQIELAYINAAITLATQTNKLGAEVNIGPFTIGISLNARLVPLLDAEAEEIEKYLRGEPNNYE